MGFFPAGVQDETLKEESQRLASHNNDFNLTLVHTVSVLSSHLKRFITHLSLAPLV